MGNTVQKIFSSDPYPESEISNFDSHYGFSGQRKERVMTVPEEVLVAAKIPHELRDYCVDLLLNYELCFRKKFPFVKNCVDEIHKYQQCEYDDYVLRMKEYERERRLLIREKKKKKALEAAAA